MFCDERVSPRNKFWDEGGLKVVNGGDKHTHTHTSFEPQKPTPQASGQNLRSEKALDASSNTNHVGQTHQEGVARSSQGGGRSGARELDNSSAQSTLDRDLQSEGRADRRHLEGSFARAEDCKPSEGRPHAVHAGEWDEGEPQQHHCPVDEPCRGNDPSGLRTIVGGTPGLREVGGQVLQRSQGTEPELRHLGHHDSEGIRLNLLETPKVCSVGATRSQCWQGDHGKEEGNERHVRSFEHRQFRDVGCLPLGALERCQSLCSEMEGSRRAQTGTGEANVASADEGESSGEGEGGARSHRDPPQEPQGDLSAISETLQPLPPESALLLSRTWHVQKNPLSQEWQALVHSNRPFLMELACYQDSVLGQEVERRFGKGSVPRVSEWNGGDLETEAGRKFAIRILRKTKPVHLWISCECGPFCPLQHLNKKTPEQKERLRLKQEAAVRQYEGALIVAEEAWKMHTEVHWELSQRTEAWRLPCIQDYEQRHELKKVICNGCTVGLRTKDQKLALCKAWCVATKNPHLLQHLNLRCQRNHPKGKCERGEAAHTARYTLPFAKRVIDALSMSESWCRTSEELQPRAESAEELLAAEDEAERDAGVLDVDISPEERNQIEMKIQKIHKNTGHGSMRNLIKALEDRGAAQKVVQVAKAWTCTVCQHRKRRDPRKFASLENIPNKWERMQVDMATWVHPKNKRKFHVLVMLDEKVPDSALHES